MEVVELNVLNTASAEDFAILRVVGVGQHGLVVAAKCTRPGLPQPDKLYAVKLLFTFMHDFSTAIRNAYENEWSILSRIVSHKNVVKYWAQFISTIPDSFISHLPDNIRSYAAPKNRSGEIVRRKGQFVVFDYYPTNLRTWLEDQPVPLPFDALYNLTHQLMEALLHLQQNRVVHLDLKLDNVLIGSEGEVVLCDFGCSSQFPTANMVMRYRHGCLIGGNKAHLSPEVLTVYNKIRQSSSGEWSIDYSQQEAWAVGVLAYEIAMGRHPFVDYPLGHTHSSKGVSYSHDAIPPLPKDYPKAFCSIIRELLHPSMSERMSIKEALKQMNLCFPESTDRRDIKRLADQLKAIKLERDLAHQEVRELVKERDDALEQIREGLKEMKELRERCQTLEDECCKLDKERRAALKASEQAMEMHELLTQQVDRLRREKDLAYKQVSDLRRDNVKDKIKECHRCKVFYIDQENGADACKWHPGRVSLMMSYYILCVYLFCPSSACPRTHLIPTCSIYLTDGAVATRRMQITRVAGQPHTLI